MPALLAVVLGILLGWATGGSLRCLSRLKLRLEWLVLPLFVLQALARGRVLGLVGASQLSLFVWTMVSCLLVCAMLLNCKIPGMALGAVGVLMNADVVLLNAAMPVALGNRLGSGSVEAAAGILQSTGGFYRLARPADLIVWLGDIIPVAQANDLLLVSPGDVVLMVAVVCIIVHGMACGDVLNESATTGT